MSYTVRVTREGEYWLAEVPDVPGANTFAKSIEGLRRSVSEAIVLMDDLADDTDVELRLEFSLADPTAARAVRVGDERARLLDLEREMRDRARELAMSLVTQGFSHRDTAALLNMTPGRVSQLVKPATDKGRAS